MLLIMMCARLHFVCNIIKSNNIAYLTNKPNDVLSHGKMRSRQSCNPLIQCGTAEERVTHNNDNPSGGKEVVDVLI